MAVGRGFRPKSKLGKTTLWFGYLAAGLQLLRLLFRSAPGSVLGGWAGFISFVFFFCGGLLILRWIRRKLMWRLRNRLVVTYIFIGVIPVLLLLGMGFIAGYLFAGQFATYVASSDLHSELERLHSTNRSLAQQFRSLLRQRRLTPELAGEIASASNENFHHRTITVWDGDTGFALGEGGGMKPAQIKVTPGLQENFSGIVLDNERLQLRAVKRLQEGAHNLTVISNMPITPELLRHTTSQLGDVDLYLPSQNQGSHPQTAGNESGSRPAGSARNHQLVIDTPHSSTAFDISADPRTVNAGELPPALNAFDMHLIFGTTFDVIDWTTGKPLGGLMRVDTRPSRIYATLFSTLGENAGAIRDVLIAIAVLLGVIELIALFIGMRLTRSMTRAVAELYAATQYVNRGELSHQIRIRSRDQMAALEQSFNSMTQSLSNLLAEQKEKHRLESELAIAHEVQELLFPEDLSGLPGLEVYGVCRPARTVSGDYYDFIPLSDSRMVLAVGDISGKGISAALLMATVHAFVRAYAFEPERTLASVALGAGGSERSILPAYNHNGGPDGELCPASLMATLNYQLYRSTPPAKYATMFLACYDATTRLLTYSNAGHLPPLLVGGDGRLQRLETSGTVVGLFDAVAYEKSSLAMQAGDIFVAYSDGITEPENEFGEFGEERLIQLISQHRDQPLARISEVVTTAVADWIAGGEQPDDVTLVLARAR
ncbi:MAG: SpoIIE family protein phosphatase [Acetobacteraceae bacterium]|nr:SpoIIE family protein phosphatase [Acetobacteraceae bacterium]